MFHGLLKMWLAIEIEDFPNWFEWQQSCFELIQTNLNALGARALPSPLSRAGATVLATRRSVVSMATVAAQALPCDELHPASALHALLPRADFVVLSEWSI